MARVLVTGAAGFIGFHLARRLLEAGGEVVGVDNLSPYYELSLKEARLARLEARPGFRFVRADLADRAGAERLFAGEGFARVAHLAAQPGVRHSLDHPHEYVDANVRAFLHVLEGCRHARVEHLVYASSSSVYGANTAMPLSVHQGVEHPLNLYAATKKANELMAHAYSHLYRIPTTGLRFFTVYGPWGRPDMAFFLFTRAILEGREIEVFGHGALERDFTYVDDVVEGVARVLERPPAPDPAWDGARPDPAGSAAPYRVYNIGNHQAVPVLTLIRTLEAALGRRARLRMLPAQPGEVPATCADVDDLARAVGFAPATPLEEGVRRFVAWYRDFYGVPAAE